MLKALKTTIHYLNLRKIRLGKKYCPICEKPRRIIKLTDNEIAVRCISCKASIVSMSIADVIVHELENLHKLHVYELSARGPLHKYLRSKCENFIGSEFYPEIKSGDYNNGILCQDVENLTFDSNSFDLCTSTDVFEHVPDDFLGFKNIYRVLKPTGKMIFTVPLYGDSTRQRVKVGENGNLEYLLPPEYHGDPISESGRILAYRNYGFDILDLLERVGFKEAKIVTPKLGSFWGIKRKVVVAQK